MVFQLVCRPLHHGILAGPIVYSHHIHTTFTPHSHSIPVHKTPGARSLFTPPQLRASQLVLFHRSQPMKKHVFPLDQAFKFIKNVLCVKRETPPASWCSSPCRRTSTRSACWAPSTTRRTWTASTRSTSVVCLNAVGWVKVETGF